MYLNLILKQKKILEYVTNAYLEYQEKVSNWKVEVIFSMTQYLFIVFLKIY